MFNRGSSKDSFFTIADIFGYVMTFLIIWFIWTTYKAATTAATKAKHATIETVAPVVTNLKSETIKLKESSEEKIQEIASPSFLSSITTSTKQFFSALSESPEDALSSINESINGVISSVGSDDPRNSRIDDNSKTERKRVKKDALSSF